MQFTIVKEVPLDSVGEFVATKVENKGESATTESPQMNRKLIKRKVELEKRNSGEMIQQKKEMNSDKIATFFKPNRSDSVPFKIHATPPEAMIKNDKSETLRFVPG